MAQPLSGGSGLGGTGGVADVPVTGGITDVPMTGGMGVTGGGGPATGGSASGGTDMVDAGIPASEPVAEVFEHCPFDGWQVSLPVGEYTTADLVALGALDNQISSMQVRDGYELILFDGDNFTGSSVRITSDLSCATAVGFNDQVSSLRVQKAGSGGGVVFSGERGSAGITSCQPAFEMVCKPSVTFSNPYADGDASHFDAIFPDIESEMQDVACTVCSMLYRSPDDIPVDRRHTTLNLNIKDIDPPAHAFGNTIEIDIDHVRNYTEPNSAYIEFRGVMVHETVHLYQHYGNGGTGEGMADCVRVQAGLYGPGRCNPGGSWQDAYTTSGCFYSWLTGPSSYLAQHHPNSDPNLPVKLNAALAGTSGDVAYDAVASVLLATFGEDVDALWAAYQADL